MGYKHNILEVQGREVMLAKGIERDQVHEQETMLEADSADLQWHGRAELEVDHRLPIAFFNVLELLAQVKDRCLSVEEEQARPKDKTKDRKDKDLAYEEELKHKVDPHQQHRALAPTGVYNA